MRKEEVKTLRIGIGLSGRLHLIRLNLAQGRRNLRAA
jgi:hypothetical protein